MSDVIVNSKHGRMTFNFDEMQQVFKRCKGRRIRFHEGKWQRRYSTQEIWVDFKPFAQDLIQEAFDQWSFEKIILEGSDID